MRIVQCQTHEANAMPFYGRLEGEQVLPLATSPFAETIRTRRDAEALPLSELRILPPIVPSKVVAIGRNYKAHAEEMGNELPKEPMMFLKPNSAVIGHGDTILLPKISERIDHEGEVALVVGKRCRHVSESEALSVILGITALNDVTARDLQSKDGQWSRAKGFDTFCPIGPAMTLGLDPTDLEVICRVNGDVKQCSRTSLLIFPIQRLIAHITQAMTLYPGDVIATGTPAGISPLQAGDSVEVEVEGVGTIVNPVAEDPDA